MNIIIGSGPTGLGASEYFSENKVSYMVFDKMSQAGGYASTINKENFKWDYGGHILYSKNKFFIKKLNKTNTKCNVISRKCYIYYKNRFIDYPFQRNISQLDNVDKNFCINELKKVIGTDIPTEEITLKSWSEKVFGKGINKIFFEPYNYKVWGYSISKLSNVWIKNFVSQPSIESINEPWGPNREFIYPEDGIGEIWKNMSKQYNIKYNTEIKRINIHKKEVITENGNIFKYDNLINTIPLKELSKISNCHVNIKKKISKLLHSNTHIIGIGVRDKIPEIIKDKHWMYFPQNNLLFYRVSILSNYSNKLCRKDCYSLLVEVCESNEKKIELNIIETVIQNLLDIKFINNKNVIVSKYYTNVKYGYPTPMFGRDKLLYEINKSFESYNIFNRGRFASHIYELSNMDDSYCIGYDIAKRIHTNEPEKKFKINEPLTWDTIWEEERKKKYSSKKSLDPREYNGDLDGTNLNGINFQIKCYNILEKMVDIKNSKFLDFGCASGHFSTYFKEFKSFIGLDRSQFMVDKFNEIHKDKKAILCKDSENIVEMEDNSIDYIVCHGVFVYFKDYQYSKNVLNEFERISKKGVFIFCSNRVSELNKKNKPLQHLCFEPSFFEELNYKTIYDDTNPNVYFHSYKLFKGIC